MINQPRPYRQAARAEAAVATTGAVKAAALQLLMQRWYDDISLDDIALEAGVSSKTVQRQFGSKENLARTVLLEYGAENSAWRDQIEAGNLEAAIVAIVGMYEALGDSLMRFLALEHKLPLAAEIIDMGRVVHKRWVERVFKPLLGSLPKRQSIALLVVATDVYVWKLLRRDAGLSQSMTVESMRLLALLALDQVKEES